MIGNNLQITSLLLLLKSICDVINGFLSIPNIILILYFFLSLTFVLQITQINLQLLGRSFTH